MGIAPEIFLDLQRQRVHPAPHVRHPGRKPDPNPARNRNHRRPRTARTRASAEPSTSRSTITREPSDSAISIRRSATIAGLTSGSTYNVQVRATNSAGTGDWSPSGNGTTSTPTNNPATGAPTISGFAQVGNTLTAATSGISDADGLTSPTYSYQWIRVDGTTDKVTWHWAPRLAVAKYGNRGVGDVDGARTGTP